MPNSLRAKCVIIGDTCVGKSAITQVFHSDGAHFPKNYTMTTGVELVTKNVAIPQTHDNVEIFIYDLAGKGAFSDLVSKFWDSPSMLMIVYDCTNEQTFNSSAKWLERIRSQKPEISCPGVLVANKIDLDQRRIISRKEGEEFAHSNGLEYFECSAKEMQNVEQPFFYLATTYYKQYEEKVEQLKTLG